MNDYMGEKRNRHQIIFDIKMISQIYILIIQ